MNARVGQFFFLIGLLLLFVFAASYQVDASNYTALLFGLGSFILGVYLIIKHRARAGETKRFRWIRKMRARDNED